VSLWYLTQIPSRLLGLVRLHPLANVVLRWPHVLRDFTNLVFIPVVDELFYNLVFRNDILRWHHPIAGVEGVRNAV